VGSVSDTYKFTYKPHEDDPEEITPTSTDVSTYVDRAMFTAEEMDADALAAPRVFLLSATPDPLGAVAAMSMMYEGRVIRDLAEITDDERRHYYDECFKTTLKAPLEAIDFHFMVEGVTRAHTHQEVRQRTAVFAQESMRFAVKEKILARPGPLISQDAEAKKTWEKGVEFIHQLYLTLIAQGIPAEEARGLLPHDTLTRLHHKVNLKNLMDELGKRTCTQAQFDWKMWAAGVKAAIHNGIGLHYAHPGGPQHQPCKKVWTPSQWQFEYIAASPIFHPICFNTGHCMFKAQMDRGCTIRERVERGAFDEIRPEEWAADPRAAWVR
jgi:flavin-dependent thymidylate synthase